MPQTLTDVTRSQFTYNINQFILQPPTPLPGWANTGGAGWPWPFFSENLWGLFQVGRWGFNAYVIPVLDEAIEELIDTFKGWIFGLSGQDDVESEDAAETIADKFEEWCEANDYEPWAA